MGNVTCCKRPNEIIEDRDLLKKSTMKRNILLKKEISSLSGQDQESPFITLTEKEREKEYHNTDLNSNIYTDTNTNTNININPRKKNKYINSIEDEDNKLVDLEKKQENIQHQGTLGPSDNLRKKKLKNLRAQSQSSEDPIFYSYNSNTKTRNEYEQTQNLTVENIVTKNNEGTKRKLTNENQRKEEIINNNNINTNININNNLYNSQYSNNNNNINNNQETDDISEKGPMDRVKRVRNKNISLNNDNRSINNNDNNIVNDNVKIKSEIKNIDLGEQSKLFENKNKYFVPPTNQSVDFINNKYLTNTPLSNSPSDRNHPSPTQENNNIQSQNIDQPLQTNNNNNNNQIIEQRNEIEEKEEKDVSDNNRNSQENENNSENEDIQVEGEDPIDSNEVYQRPNDEEVNADNENINNNENINDNNTNENKEKEKEEEDARNSVEQVNASGQLSNSEIDALYKLCLSKGETVPDDDFSVDNYKQFYPEDEPFFNFDKGEVAHAKIVISPDDIELLEIYDGEINDEDKKHGYGVSTTAFYVRKGNWRDGEFTGWGRESRRNYDVLEGKFVNGLLNGKGYYKNNQGNIYVGDFVNSQRDGYGELSTNRIHYIGEFKEDKLNGKGVIEFLKEGQKYEGDFKDNDINGVGIFSWKNGDVYEGEMSNGKMNGHGIYKYANGQIYDGEYVDGIREGKGRIIYEGKVIYDGEFKGGHRFEQGEIRDSSRSERSDFGENKDNNEENEESPQN